MKFKVGDRVKILDGENKGFTGIIVAMRDSSTYPYGVKLDTPGHNYGHNEDWNITRNGELGDDNTLELITNKPKLMKLNTMMKKLLDKDVRTLIKAEYLNGDLEFTDAGKEALFSILFADYKEELVKLAKEVIEETKEK